MKKAVLILLAAAVSALAFAGLNTANAETVFNGRFDNSSTIIRGGTLTEQEFTRKYKENKTGDLPAIFQHYKINPNNISSARDGVVHANGDVTVDGIVVATDAWAVGRQTAGSPDARPLTINGKTYYEKPAEHSLASHKAATAFVFLDKNGKYTGAFLKSCANPIVATPKEPKVTPKPKPTPKPAAECQSLEGKITNRNQYTLDAEASVSNGATITGYHFVIENSEGQEVLERTVSTSEKSASIDGELEPGEYTAKVTIKTSEGDKTGTKCETRLIVEEDEPAPQEIEVCNLETKQIVKISEDEFDAAIHSMDLEDCEEAPVTPNEPEEPVQELPRTGFGQQIAGALGIGSIIASAGYYVASRRGLIDTILQR